MPRVIIVDWDGTATVEDTLIKAMEVFGDWQLYLEASAALRRGEITLHEEIRRDAEGIKVPLEDVQRWVVENIELRAGFDEFARKHDPVIVSSNFRQLIEPILSAHGLELEVRANEVEWHPDGWRASFRNNDACGACGEPCKRGDLEGAEHVVYVGDGYSDRCAAQLADRVFARRALARYLDEQGVAYEPYEDFFAIERALAGPRAT
jgi:2-hydroxy-3-keto-5-methylthiopentenyl-1-phosphate phosphatase